jgi:hypothetical protein
MRGLPLMLAHIVGVPVEESLPWIAPVGGLGAVGALVVVRTYVADRWSALRRRGGEPS